MPQGMANRRRFRGSSSAPPSAEAYRASRALAALRDGCLSRRGYSRQLVQAALYSHGPASRVEIGQVTGMTPASLTAICRDLLRDGLVRESRRAPPSGNSRGRRRTLLEVALDTLAVACLGYGRDHIEAAVVTLAGSLCWRHRWEGPFGKAPRDLLRRLAAALRTALRESPVALDRLVAVGAADPGLVQRATGRVLRAANLPGWEDVPLAQILGRASGLPIVLDREDGLQALGEVAFGAGQGAEHILYVTLLDGVGGGIVQGGRLLSGRDGSVGEIGHLRVSDGGPVCACGLEGCLEAHIAPARLLDRLREAGRKLSFPAFLRAARKGDPVCREHLDQAADKLARAVGSTLNLLNPERVILGGLFIEMGDLILNPLRDALPRYAFPEMIRGLDVRLGELRGRSEFLGIAAFVREALFAHPTGGGRAAGSR